MSVDVLRQKAVVLTSKRFDIIFPVVSLVAQIQTMSTLCQVWSKIDAMQVTIDIRHAWVCCMDYPRGSIVGYEGAAADKGSVALQLYSTHFTLTLYIGLLITSKLFELRLDTTGIAPPSKPVVATFNPFDT